MKILLMNTCYPFGSTGRIVQALENYYKDLGHETTIIYGQGPKINGNYFKITSLFYRKLQAFRSRVTGVMYGGCFLSTCRAIKIIKKEKPDIVHLHCLNSNFINIFKILSWLNENRIKTVLTNHAEFMYTANCGYAFDCVNYLIGCRNCPRFKSETKSWFLNGTHKSWKKMKEAFNGFDSLFIINVSPWLNERASNSVILKGFNHLMILNGINTSFFKYRGRAEKNNVKTVLHVTSKFSDDERDRKGGKYVIELARRLEKENVKFIVAGKVFLSQSVPSNMVLLGNVENEDELAKLYSSSDLVVITSKKETFSMIVAESLCCGTPVVGFKAGAPEMISIPKYSEFVEFGDTDALLELIIDFLNRPFDKKTISEEAIKTYSMEKMANEYLRVYSELIKQS